MKNVKRILMAVLFLPLLACGKSLERQIVDDLSNMDQARLGKGQVRIDKLRRTGNHAVAEVTLKTAVKLIRKDRAWVVEEIRLGDRRWEKVENILAALAEERSLRTRSDLKLIDSAISRYRLERGELPPAGSYRELMDHLAPEYMQPTTELDGWFNQYVYRTLSAKDYDLRSAGPDGIARTSDDVTLEQP
ncbi:MAG: type II secretion system protein GspG [Acidobacteriota bacterium]|nr:type II secretion system protein GspG [Acidobacteriota bacterium]